MFSTHSDTWSYGVLMWEILHKRAPYPMRTPIEVALDVGEGRLSPDFSDTPEHFRTLAEQIHRFDPATRIPFTQIVQYWSYTLDPEGTQTASEYQVAI